MNNFEVKNLTAKLTYARLLVLSIDSLLVEAAVGLPLDVGSPLLVEVCLRTLSTFFSCKNFLLGINFLLVVATTRSTLAAHILF